MLLGDLLLRMMAQASLAGCEDHGCGCNLSHECCIMVGPADEPFGGESKLVCRSLNSTEHLHMSRQKSAASFAINFCLVHCKSLNLTGCKSDHVDWHAKVCGDAITQALLLACHALSDGKSEDLAFLEAGG